MTRWTIRLSCLLLMTAAAVGCGGTTEPAVAEVEGTVTVDGKPGADLQVVFEPQSNGGSGKAGADVGGSSIGLTDAGGHYVLKYKGANKEGAVLGKHVVRITNVAGGGPAGGANAVSLTPLPQFYNTASTLTADVEKGENTKDFELRTK